jgi:hypothetical protein
MGDNRWPKRILTGSLEGGKRREKPDVKWDREVKTVMMQRTNTSRRSKAADMAKSD